MTTADSGRAHFRTRNQGGRPPPLATGEEVLIVTLNSYVSIRCAVGAASTDLGTSDSLKIPTSPDRAVQPPRTSEPPSATPLSPVQVPAVQ